MKLAVCNPLPDLNAENVLTALCPNTGARSLTEASCELNCKPWELKLWLIAHPRVEALVRSTQASMLRDVARNALVGRRGVEPSAGQIVVRRMWAELLWRLADRLEEHVSRDLLTEFSETTVRVQGATEDDLARRQGESLGHWGERVHELYRDLQERCALAAAENGRNVEVTGVGPDRMEIALNAIEQVETWSRSVKKLT